MADLKIGNKTLAGVSKVLTKNTSGNDVNFISPSGTVNLYNNGTFDVSQYEQAVVDVAEDSGSVVAGTILNASQYKSGTYPCTGGNDVLSGITIEIGFRPKIFFIIGVGSIYNGSTATPYKLGSSISVYDDDGNSLLQYSSFIMKGDSTNGYGRGGASNGNGFAATATGVQGFGDNIKAASGITYNWYAWG